MRYVRTLWSVHFSAFCNVSFEVYLHLSLYLYLYFIRNENCSVAPRFLEDMSRPSRPLQQPVGVAMPVVPPPRPVGPQSMSLGNPALPFGPRGYNGGPLAQDLGQYGPIGQPVPHGPSGASGWPLSKRTLSFLVISQNGSQVRMGLSGLLSELLRR